MRRFPIARILRPGRDEPPSQESELAACARGRCAYCRHGLGRGDVVARGKRGEAGDAELLGKDLVRLE